MNKFSLLILACLCTVLTACGFSNSIKPAEDAVAQFRLRVAGNKFGEIYDQAHADFTSSGSREQITEYLRDIMGKLGPFQSTNRTGWHVSTNNGVTDVELTYTTVYKNGTGTEEFILRVEGEKAILRGYHVKSPALLSKEQPTEPKSGQANP